MPQFLLVFGRKNPSLRFILKNDLLSFFVFEIMKCFLPEFLVLFEILLPIGKQDVNYIMSICHPHYSTLTKAR